MPTRFASAFLLLIALALGACSYTTDTAATVGSERITVGEFNAEIAKLREQIGPARWDSAGEAARRDVKAEWLQRMIDNRLIQLEARGRGITISDAEIRARMEAERAQFAQGFAQQRQQGLDQLAAGATQQLRPIVNARGGGGLPDNDLRALVRAEIERLQAALEGRGQVVTRDVPDGLVRDRAAALAAALAARGVTVPPGDLAPTLRAVAEQLAGANSSADDSFERDLSSNGVISGGAYRDRVRDQLLAERLRPLYAPDQITAVTLQQVITDRRERAQEALDRARGGVPFNDLVQQYALEAFRNEQAVTAGTIPAEAISPELRTLFPSLQEGAYSGIQSVQGNRGETFYRFFRVARVERRAPNDQELGLLRQGWVEGLRDKYPITISPDLGLPAASAQ